MFYIVFFTIFLFTCIPSKPGHLLASDLDTFFKKNPISVLLFLKKDCVDCSEHEKLFKDMEDIFENYVSFAVADASVALKYKVSKFPSVKVFQDYGKKDVDFKSGLTPEHIYQHVLKLIQSDISARYKKKGFVQRDTYVVSLDESNFTQTIQNSPDHYLVEFYAPWCGHCKALAPAWKEAAKKLFGKMTLVAVDATVNQNLASKYDIKGFPTIKFIPAKSKDIYSAQDYTGGRTTDDIVKWAESKLLTYVVPPELIQVTDQTTFETECLSKGICVLAFFPSQLDSDAKTWNEYIKILNDVMNSFKVRNFGWVWIEGVLNEKFEEALDVGGFGYPAVVAINYQKKAFSLMRSSFSGSSITSFLNGLGSKSASSKKMPGDLPQIKDTPKWDGSTFKKVDL